MKGSRVPAFVGLKMTHQERQVLVLLARQEGDTLSGYIRSLISREAQRSVCGSSESHPCGYVVESTCGLTD